MDFSKITDWICNAFNTVKANDFNRGYFIGVCVGLAVVIVLLIIKIIFKIIFRRRRCRELQVISGAGAVVIGIKALEDTVRSELTGFSSVKINQIRLYRIRKKYMFNIACEYDGSDGSLVQITDKIRSVLNKMFTEFYGVNSIRTINLKFERLSKVKQNISDKSETSDIIQEIPPIPTDSDAGKKSGNDDDIF